MQLCKLLFLLRFHKFTSKKQHYLTNTCFRFPPQYQPRVPTVYLPLCVNIINRKSDLSDESIQLEDKTYTIIHFKIIEGENTSNVVVVASNTASEKEVIR